MILTILISFIGSVAINYLGHQNDWSYTRILVACLVWGFFSGVIGSALTYKSE